jgi:uncharacterized protein (DUF1697 family)
LRALCSTAGFENVRTYIASGNVVFESALTPIKAQARLRKQLQAHMGRPVDVLIRDLDEMQAVLRDNPFPEAAPNRNLVIFLDQPVDADALQNVQGQREEQIALGQREIYIHYGSGMAQSKLRIPAAKAGTARNMNTVAKLVEMARSDA